MIRSVLTSILFMTLFVSCAKFEQRAARYDAHQCPICQNATNGVCTYCNGTKKCMFCQGKKDRTTAIPNRTEPGINKISYSMPCPYCNQTGICTYCEQTGKCWTCNGTGKVSDDWSFLRSRKPSEAKITE